MALSISQERNTNVLIYVKRRLGMCARKLGKLKEAAKIFRDVNICAIHHQPLSDLDLLLF